MTYEPPPPSPQQAFHASPPPVAPPGAQQPQGGGVRWIPLVIGIALTVLGTLLALAGAVTLIAFGNDGRLDSGSGRLETSTAALVSEVADIQYDQESAEVLGDSELSLTADSSGGKPVFVGIGPAADVDRYLSGVAIDRVRDIEVDPFRVDTTRIDGSAGAEPPGDQTFWTAKGQSADSSTFDFKLTDGDYRMVVMNADGSPGVAADTSLGITIPNLWDIGLGVLIGGVICLIAGIVLIVLGSRRRRPTTTPV